MRHRKKTLGASGRFIPNPKWAESDECFEAVADALGPLGGFREIEDYFPKRYGKAIPADGGWIMVKSPPTTEFTVPPLSMWWAKPWPMECAELHGICPMRYRIKTPAGDLGIFPRECAPIADITQYFGREKEGVLLRPLDGRPVFNTDRLHYVMSRGVHRQAAQMLLIGEMQGDAFFWIEIAPQYSAMLTGTPWPSAERSPFATPEENWIAT